MDKSPENMWETQTFVKSEVARPGYSVRNKMHACYLILNNITSYPYSAWASQLSLEWWRTAILRQNLFLDCTPPDIQY